MTEKNGCPNCYNEIPPKPKTRKPYTMSEKARAQRRKAGKANAQKNGRAHMQEIGRKGSKATWEKYKLIPHGPNQFAMVDRKTGKVKAIRY